MGNWGTAGLPCLFPKGLGSPISEESCAPGPPCRQRQGKLGTVGTGRSCRSLTGVRSLGLDAQHEVCLVMGECQNPEAAPVPSGWRSGTSSGPRAHLPRDQGAWMRACAPPAGSHLCSARSPDSSLTILTCPACSPLKTHCVPDGSAGALQTTQVAFDGQLQNRWLLAPLTPPLRRTLMALRVRVGSGGSVTCPQSTPRLALRVAPEREHPEACSQRSGSAGQAAAGGSMSGTCRGCRETGPP